MIVRSLVTRECPSCGDPIEPGGFYDNTTGECIACVNLQKYSDPYNKEDIVRAADHHIVMSKIEQ